jgi:hypothetical protein
MLRKILTVGLISFMVAGAAVWRTYASSQFSVRFIEQQAELEDMPDPFISLLYYQQANADTDSEFVWDTSGATSDRGTEWSISWSEFSPAEEKQYKSVRQELGPPKVGIQAGHWRNSEVPKELEALKKSGRGAIGGWTDEVTVVLEIAERVKTLLEAEGLRVDLLPATVPVDYLADAFVSIHADGNSNPDLSGFKISGPYYDFSGKSELLVKELYETYEQATGLPRDPHITRRMSGYYAFNWRRYDHALHPMTPAVIIETGFLTSPEDREIILSDPDRAARGIAEGLLRFIIK